MDCGGSQYCVFVRQSHLQPILYGTDGKIVVKFKYVSRRVSVPNLRFMSKERSGVRMSAFTAEFASR